MSQKTDLFKKRTFVSPQKSHRSIRTFAINKPPSKKVNSNKSPDRPLSPLSTPLPESPPSVRKGKTGPSSPLARSFSAIVPASTKAKYTSNSGRNFYSPIAQNEDETLEFPQEQEPDLASQEQEGTPAESPQEILVLEKEPNSRNERDLE